MRALRDSERAASVIYYKVDDISAAHETLAGRGVRFRDQPHRIARLPTHDLWMVFLDDSEGNLVGLMSEVPYQG